MSDSVRVQERADAEVLGAVVAGLVPGQDPRVAQEAARMADRFGVPLVIATVDAGTYVSYDDPAGMMGGAAIDLAITAAAADAAQVERESIAALVDTGVDWSMRRLAGEPSQALTELADAVQASLIVVGTRKPGFGETLREFLNGSVAARLSHRQQRSVLVVPSSDGDEPAAE